MHYVIRLFLFSLSVSTILSGCWQEKPGPGSTGFEGGMVGIRPLLSDETSELLYVNVLMFDGLEVPPTWCGYLSIGADVEPFTDPENSELIKLSEEHPAQYQLHLDRLEELQRSYEQRKAAHSECLEVLEQLERIPET